MLFEQKISTYSKEQLIEITDLIYEAVKTADLDNGSVIVFVPHTTAGITINENADPAVKKDILTGLQSLNLEKLPFTHLEGNSPAHIKASLMGSSVNILLMNGKLLLGTWQGIFFCEFDGPRTRKVWIRVNK